MKGLFEDWLETHFPDRKDKVLNRIRSMRGGKLNDGKPHNYAYGLTIGDYEVLVHLSEADGGRLAIGQSARFTRADPGSGLQPDDEPQWVVHRDRKPA